MSAQSWLDLILSPTMDPRGLVSNTSFSTGPGAFLRSTNWLQAVAWVSPPMKVSAPGVGTTSNIMAVNPQDFTSIEAAATWNATHAMTTNNAQLPLVAEGLMFLRSGTNFQNNLFFDITGGTTLVGVQLSFRDNSYTAGDFTAGATGTIPVFDFGAGPFSGAGKQMTVTLLQPGRFSMGLRLVDNAGNYSMFPMEWIVI